MTDYTCVKRLSKCKMFDVNNLSKDTSMYDIHYRKCSIHKGELLEKDEDIKYCDEAQTVLNENDIKLLLDSHDDAFYKLYEKSLLIAVITEVSVVKAIDAIGLLFLIYLPTNSAERCCASAAEPPLPQNIIFWPA